MKCSEVKWSPVKWSEVKWHEVRWSEVWHPCSAHHGPSGRSRDEVPFNIFSRLLKNCPKHSLVSRTVKKRRFHEMPNRNGAIYNRLRGTKSEKKDARRHFWHSRLRPLGLFFSDFQEKRKHDLKALVCRARSQQQRSGFAGSYFPWEITRFGGFQTSFLSRTGELW